MFSTEYGPPCERLRAHGDVWPPAAGGAVSCPGHGDPADRASSLSLPALTFRPSACPAVPDRVDSESPSLTTALSLRLSILSVLVSSPGGPITQHTHTLGWQAAGEWVTVRGHDVLITPGDAPCPEPTWPGTTAASPAAF